MLKGLAITPPVIGRISIGRVIEKNGKRLPEKDDQFTITTQVQNHGDWVLHPFDDVLRKAGNGKLRAIPVRLLFNEPELNLRADYSAFNKEHGRPICVGNGETCRRSVNSQIETLPCPSPAACEFGLKLCKPYARLNVGIGDEDELGSFIFRTTSINSIRTLAARLHYFQAVSGGNLATLPLELKLRGKSTTQSHRTPIYYVDLVIRADITVEEAIAHARDHADKRKAAGFEQLALDEAARQGFANGAFEDAMEETSSVREEFFAEPDAIDGAENGTLASNMSLTDKLKAKSEEGAS